MLNKINIVNKSSTTSVTCITPEKIDLNMKKIEEQSFFKEVNRNTDDYKKLLQEAPVLLEKYWYRFSESELGNMCYTWQSIDKSLNGQYRVKEIPVKVVAIQYSGGNNFIFELTKL